ncbi:MAG: M15 family metallopeptidase [Bacteroidota bacterium]
MNKYLLLLSLLLPLLWACDQTTPNNTSTDTPPTTPTPLPTALDTAEVAQSTSDNNTFTYDYDTAQWTELIQLEPGILLDMRYATDNNFVKEQMYDCGRCFLRPAVAKAVAAAHRQLQEGGLGLKMYDCFRPRPIQQKLWDKVPNASYVTPPAKGSMHNRGAAVDLTIVDAEGKELDMGTDFDFFGRKAHQDFTDLPENILANRQLLKSTMASVGLRHIRTEWWHYSFPGKEYELSDMLWLCKESGD